MRDLFQFIHIIMYFFLKKKIYSFDKLMKKKFKYFKQL